MTMNKMLKSILFFLPIICLLCYSCSSDEDKVAEVLMNTIENLEAEIDALIETSTGESSDDCRTVFIGGGNRCGPFYAYGIVGVDTARLELLFQQLGRAKDELFNLQGGPVCDVIPPYKDSLINGECRFCHATFDGNGNVNIDVLDCF